MSYRQCTEILAERLLEQTGEIEALSAALHDAEVTLLALLTVDPILKTHLIWATVEELRKEVEALSIAQVDLTARLNGARDLINEHLISWPQPTPGGKGLYAPVATPKYKKVAITPYHAGLGVHARLVIRKVKTKPAFARHTLFCVGSETAWGEKFDNFTFVRANSHREPDGNWTARSHHKFKQTTHIVGFLTYVCTTQGVPPLVVDGDRKTGGVALVTWSLSNMALLAILGDPGTLDSASAAVLSRCLRKVVLYDCPNVMAGAAFPAAGSSPHFPLFSAEVPAAQRPAAFAQWISSYFAPPPPGARVTAETIRACAVLPARAPTVCTLTADEFADTFEPSVIERSGLILGCSGLLATLHQNAHRALLDADAVLPGVDAVALWCDQSAWICVWGTRVLQDFLEEQPAPGKRKRRMSIKKLENANHFLHWDEPERFVSVLKEVV